MSPSAIQHKHSTVGLAARPASGSGRPGARPPPLADAAPCQCVVGYPMISCWPGPLAGNSKLILVLAPAGPVVSLTANQLELEFKARKAEVGRPKNLGF
jgi:hypothetical protein